MQFAGDGGKLRVDRRRPHACFLQLLLPLLRLRHDALQQDLRLVLACSALLDVPLAAVVVGTDASDLSVEAADVVGALGDFLQLGDFLRERERDRGNGRSR